MVKKPSKIPLIIDCQVFQTASWHRGMGKYSKAFLGAILQNEKIDQSRQIHFLFNKNRESNQEIEQFINQAYANAEFIYADLATPKEPRSDFSIAPVVAANKSTLHQLLHSKFGQIPDFMILALYLDEVCPVFPDASQDKVLIYYDSIPYLYHERYNGFAGFFDNFYLPHTATVYEATKLLTISKTVANDLHVMFGLPEDKIFNIDGASIPRTAEQPKKPEGIDVEKDRFILMPTGQELRKNNVRAVRAFEQYRTRENSHLKLIITSYFTDEGRAELEALSPQAAFSGNVSEGEMLWLLKNCNFVFFPSEYEGLGLPVLEAAEQQKLVACSDISVFREMSKTAFHYFDPLNIDAIADTLSSLSKQRPAGADLKNMYADILARYNWDNTASHAASALDAPVWEEIKNKKKVAIFCPEPSGFSAIGKVVTESHAWYQRYFDITYYFDQGPNHESIRPLLLPHLAPSHHIGDFTAQDYDQYDAVIYHIGNSEYHLGIIHTALALPGYAILHDTYLTGAYANLGQLGYMTPRRLEIEAQLDKLMPDAGQGVPKSANLTSIVNNQRAIIAHSNYARDAARRKLLDDTKIPIKKINLPVDTPIFGDIVHDTSNKLNIAFAGIIAKVKGTDIIELIALSEEFADCSINIFGYTAVEPERLERLKSLPHVNLVTNPNDHEFQNLMASTDILVNVRLAYKGETSLTTLEAMRYGVAVVLRNFGWYAELPDDAVVKVESPEATIEAIRELIDDTARFKGLKSKSQEYIKRHFSHKNYAEEMYSLISKKRAS